MALSYYNQILLEAGPANNLPQLNAKIQSLVYQPEKLLSFYRKILIALGALNVAAQAAYGYYGGADPKMSGFAGAALGGFTMLISYGLIITLKYKIVAFIVRKLCPSLIDNKNLSKEEKLKTVNGLIAETKQAMAKVKNEKDKQNCEKALSQLQSALIKIQQQV